MIKSIILKLIDVVNIAKVPIAHRQEKWQYSKIGYFYIGLLHKVKKCYNIKVNIELAI